MHIAIASRLMAEKASALIKTPHAIISITDPDSDLPSFAPNENRIGILSLRFYDLEDIREETNRIGDDEACRPVRKAMTAGHCQPPLGEPLTGNEPRSGIDSLRMLGYVE